MLYSGISIIPAMSYHLYISSYAWLWTGNLGGIFDIFNDPLFQCQVIFSVVLFCNWQFGRVAVRRLKQAFRT